MLEINLLAVLAAAIGGMVVGALWYSPILFAKRWMKLVKTSDNQMKGSSQLYMVTAGLNLVMAYVLAHFLVLLQVVTLADALSTALWVWLGFVATTSLINALFTKKSMELYALENGHHLVVLLVMSIVLYYLR